MTQYTYRQAAKRVNRSVRTIKRWRKAGMPMGVVNGFRVVEEDVLLKWWRERLQNWPTHQWRMRKLMRNDEHEPEEHPTMTDKTATVPSIADITRRISDEHTARLDQWCRAALADPERRGVLIERAIDLNSNRIEYTYSLSHEVPYGEIHERTRA